MVTYKIRKILKFKIIDNIKRNYKVKVELIDDNGNRRREWLPFRNIYEAMELKVGEKIELIGVPDLKKMQKKIKELLEAGNGQSKSTDKIQ